LAVEDPSTGITSGVADRTVARERKRPEAGSVI
jgi:hypothetical protein